MALFLEVRNKKKEELGTLSILYGELLSQARQKRRVISKADHLKTNMWGGREPGTKVKKDIGWVWLESESNKVATPKGPNL